MGNIKDTVRENLINFRKANKLTQIELADKIGYSDKAVSRWEHGDVIPDIETLDNLARVYGVDITAFFKENPNIEQEKRKKLQIGNKLTISLLSILAVWFIATIAHIYVSIIFNLNIWEVFVLAVPVSCVLGIVFSAIWGSRRLTFVVISMLIWSTLAYLYIHWLNYNLWHLFFVGIPLQIAVVLCANLRRSGGRDKQ